MTPRQQAKAEGRRTFQGNPCVHGHSGERYASNNMCVECLKAHAANYYAKLKRALAAVEKAEAER
jgi:hypothetical protein